MHHAKAIQQRLPSCQHYCSDNVTNLDNSLASLEGHRFAPPSMDFFLFVESHIPLLDFALTWQQHSRNRNYFRRYSPLVSAIEENRNCQCISLQLQKSHHRHNLYMILCDLNLLCHNLCGIPHKNYRVQQNISTH